MRGIPAILFAPCLAASLLMSVPSAGALDGAEKGSGTLIDELRQKVKAAGWQVILVPGEGEAPGFLFTIGLWQIYNHPEVLLFAPSSDPRDMGGSIQRLVERVRAGERFEPGKSHEGFFNQYPGRFREIDRRWYPEFLGTAGGYYESFDFPALQLFWPDRQGRFPWESEFNRSLFSLQPILSERNLVLANLPDGTLSLIEQSDGIRAFEATIEQLLVKVDAQPAELLEDWRWRIGEEVAHLGTTIFGDLIVQEPDGAVYFLDTARDGYVHIADNRDGWLRAMVRRPEDLLHAPLLLELRSLGYELAPGEVYDFLQEPMIGGAESIGNVQKIPARVHLSHTGRLAMALRDLPAGARVDGFEFTPVSSRGPETDPAMLFSVVINAEEQYSIWPVGEEIPAGWRSVGKSGTREQCLSYIAEVWTDMRPLSLRETIDARGPEQQ